MPSTAIYALKGLVSVQLSFRYDQGSYGEEKVSTWIGHRPFNTSGKSEIIYCDMIRSSLSIIHVFHSGERNVKVFLMYESTTLINNKESTSRCTYRNQILNIADVVDVQVAGDQ